MLRDIVPEYLDLADVMEDGPQYVPTLKATRGKWELKIHEQWPDGIDYKSLEAVELDKRCIWCNQQLSKWSGVERQSWAFWHFDNKHDAEKFITLYYLKWQ